MRRADLPGTCPVCDLPIAVGEPIAPKRGGWIHAGCASGSDES